MDPAVDWSTVAPSIPRMRLAALLALLAASCSHPRGELACSVPPFQIRAEAGPLDCAAVEADVALVRAALDTAPERWRVAAGDFDSTFRGLDVFVHPDPTFTRDSRSWVGRFDLVDGVELGSRGDALPHELLHAVDVERGELLTGLHLGWDWEFDDQATGQMSGAWSP